MFFFPYLIFMYLISFKLHSCHVSNESGHKPQIILTYALLTRPIIAAHFTYTHLVSLLLFCACNLLLTAFK